MSSKIDSVIQSYPPEIIFKYLRRVPLRIIFPNRPDLFPWETGLNPIPEPEYPDSLRPDLSPQKISPLVLRKLALRSIFPVTTIKLPPNTYLHHGFIHLTPTPTLYAPIDLSGINGCFLFSEDAYFSPSAARTKASQFESRGEFHTDSIKFLQGFEPETESQVQPYQELWGRATRRAAIAPTYSPTMELIELLIKTLPKEATV